MGRDTAEVIEQLLSQNLFTVQLYEIQVKDTGTCTASGSIITDSTKAWMTSEWADNTAIFTDSNNDTYIVSSNTTDTITVSGSPAEGEYTIERWFYLSSHIEGLDSEGKPASITYGTDSFSRAKVYIPYPVNHKVIHDHEIGKFPQLQISVYNPGTEAFSAYYDLEDFDFYYLFERYSAFRGNTLNVIIAFIDSDGDMITSPSDANITNKFTIMNSDVDRDLITFTVSSLGNFSDKQIPTRVFSKVTCGWIYKGEKCLYDSSDPSLTTSITRCNKLLKSNVFQQENEATTSETTQRKNISGIVITHVSGNTFALPEGTEIPSEMEDYVLGCIVQTPMAPYLWRVTAVSGNILTITSYAATALLSSYLDDYDQVRVNIYEKESCYGHADTGVTTVVNPLFDTYSTKGYCKYNDIVFNGDFSAVGQGDPLVRWSPTGNVSVRSGYAFIEGAASLTQELYDPAVPATDLLLGTGKKFNLVFRYYGASTAVGETKTMSYTFTAEIPDGTARYWNATTKAFQPGSYSNTITLRPYTQRLGISSYTDTQKDEVRYFKFDEYHTQIVLEYGGTQAAVGNINLTINTVSGSEVVFNYVSCIMHNQFERFGGFPGIPTTRFWYF